MKVRMGIQVTGTRNGHDWPAPGGTIDIPDDEAQNLINHGDAERVDAEPLEAAAIAPDEPERAVKPTTRATLRGGR